jgi:4-hydroxy-3-polyprenylbenzoate decarboxylase
MKTHYKNLRDYVARLEAKGELLRIKSRVSPVLEITEITDRASKSPGGGKAILFENVEGSEFPVLTNAFGSNRRISLALGCDNLDELAERMKNLLDQTPPQTMAEKLKFIPKAVSWSRYLPRIRKFASPPCQEVVLRGDDVDLSKLPVLHCWPEDGGRFFTLPVVFTKGLNDGKRNAGMYRMQIFDKNTTGMHWHIHKDGSHQYNEYRKAGRRMEVAVAVGTDPAITYAATAPAPRGVDEMILAGFIRQASVEMVKGITVDIEVPAEAEFILEGYVNPDELRSEGPFGDHTGYYSPVDEYPVFHVTTVTHRKNPIYSATVVGRPPMEDCYLALATERLFLPILKTVMPEITDYLMPWEGVFHNIVVVAIDKEYPHHARKVMDGLWGMGQMSFAKAILIIDDERYLKNGESLVKHILNTLDLHDDITITDGILDVLDHSAPQPLYGSKIGVDATRRIAGEPSRGSWIQKKEIEKKELLVRLRKKDPAFLDLRKIFKDTRNPLILVKIAKNRTKNSSHFIKKIVSSKEIAGQGIFLLYDADIDLWDNSLVLWKAFNNTDPSRDITFTENGAVIDATKKGPQDGHNREWPDDINMLQEVRKRIDLMRLQL